MSKIPINIQNRFTGGAQAVVVSADALARKTQYLAAGSIHHHLLVVAETGSVVAAAAGGQASSTPLQYVTAKGVAVAGCWHHTHTAASLIQRTEQIDSPESSWTMAAAVVVVGMVFGCWRNNRNRNWNWSNQRRALVFQASVVFLVRIWIIRGN